MDDGGKRHRTFLKDFPDSLRAKKDTWLHGLQAWVALPLETEEQEPNFKHFDREELPEFEVEGVTCQLIAGEAFGRQSPVKTDSKLFYFSASMPTEHHLNFDPQGQEAAMYLLRGEVEVDEQTFSAPTMLIFKRDMNIHIHSERSRSLRVVWRRTARGVLVIFIGILYRLRKSELSKPKTVGAAKIFRRFRTKPNFLPLPE